MANLPDDDELARIIRDVKEYGGIRALAEVAQVSLRTVYRHADPDDEERPKMEGGTRTSLVLALNEAGLLGDYDQLALAGAVKELKRRATAARGGGGRGRGGQMIGELRGDEGSGEKPG